MGERLPHIRCDNPVLENTHQDTKGYDKDNYAERHLNHAPGTPTVEGNPTGRGENATRVTMLAQHGESTGIKHHFRDGTEQYREDDECNITKHLRDHGS